jgi:hypothetical protein
VRRERRVGFRRCYGANPLHLVGHLLALAIVAFAVDRIVSGGGVSSGGVSKLLMWYLGLVIAHDLIFVPLYTGLDRVVRGALERLSSRRRVGIPMINHVRAPLMISGLLLIIYGPLISRLSDRNYFALTGHHLEHYLRNWLLITGVLFFGSGAIYLLRVSRLKTRRSKAIVVGSDLRVRPDE